MRDTTGNRRFWPVKTRGGGTKHTWDITSDEVNQIWAEALTYVKAGERLDLPADIEALAKTEQRQAMESDEREGLVREYLDTLLPENWASMSTYERCNFLNGTDFGTSPVIGTVRRNTVCNMEVWCECFGKDRANISRTESNNLTAILKRIGWVRQEKKARIPIYGSQYIYVREDCS